MNFVKYTIQYVNAGHCPPLLCSDTEIRYLGSSCTILGAEPEFRSLESKRFSYLPGTIVMCYTDGLTEVKNNNGEFFDEDYVVLFSEVDPDLHAAAAAATTTVTSDASVLSRTRPPACATM